MATSADPLWYKDAVFYQLHVKSFADSNEDGIGDFQGLAAKLDHVASLPSKQRSPISGLTCCPC